MERVNRNIKSIRKQKKLSSQHMAGKLGINASSYNRIETGDTALTMDRFLQIADVLDMEPEELLSGGKPDYVTYVPVNVRAGNLAEYADHPQDVVTFKFPLLNETGLFLVNVDGDSMYPTFSHGDNVFVKLEETTDFIKWGEPYMIDAVDGRVLKRIYKHPKQKDRFILKSDNQVYEPYDIGVKEIRSLWRVKGRFSKNLSPVR